MKIRDFGLYPLCLLAFGGGAALPKKAREDVLAYN